MTEPVCEALAMLPSQRIIHISSLLVELCEFLAVNYFHTWCEDSQRSCVELCETIFDGQLMVVFFTIFLYIFLKNFPFIARFECPFRVLFKS